MNSKGTNFPLIFSIRLYHQTSVPISSHNLSFTCNYQSVPIQYTIVDQPSFGVVECLRPQSQHNLREEFQLCSNFVQNEINEVLLPFKLLTNFEKLMKIAILENAIQYNANQNSKVLLFILSIFFSNESGIDTQQIHAQSQVSSISCNPKKKFLPLGSPPKTDSFAFQVLIFSVSK